MMKWNRNSGSQNKKKTSINLIPSLLMIILRIRGLYYQIIEIKNLNKSLNLNYWSHNKIQKNFILFLKQQYQKNPMIRRNHQSMHLQQLWVQIKIKRKNRTVPPINMIFSDFQIYKICFLMTFVYYKKNKK